MSAAPNNKARVTENTPSAPPYDLEAYLLIDPRIKEEMSPVTICECIRPLLCHQPTSGKFNPEAFGRSIKNLDIFS